MDKKKPFNQSKCDWKYMAACTADVNCADDCDMECRYKKKDKTLDESVTELVCKHKDIAIVPTNETIWGIDDRYYIQCYDCNTVLSEELTRKEAEDFMQKLKI